MQGLKVISMEISDLRVEGREDALLAISLAIMRGNVQIEETRHMMMITIILEATSTTMIEGMIGTMAKENECRTSRKWSTLQENQGTPGMNALKSTPLCCCVNDVCVVFLRMFALELLCARP